MAFPTPIRKEVRQLQKGKCAYCGCQGKLEIHHIVPESHNGTDHIANAIGLCPECHSYFDDLALRKHIYYDDF